MSRHLLLLAIVAFALIAAPFVASAQPLPPVPGVPSAAKGKALAERWCASCHLVGPDQATASSDMPPPFAELAKGFPQREAEYQAFLQAPHSPMIEISMSRENIADIMAYLHSLAPATGK
jgi:mono/diheme cytochrome c family protein